MFKKLKISTAITGIVVLFTLIQVGVIAFSLMNAVANNKNFQRIQVSVVNNNAMQDAMFNVNGALVQLNGMLLQSSLNRPLDPSMMEAAKIRIELARHGMSSFLETPFNSTEEQAAAEALSKKFDVVMGIVQGKFSYLNDPTQLPDTIHAEGEARDEMRSQLQHFSEVNSRLNDSYRQQAESDYDTMVMMSIAALVFALVFLVLVRIWVQRVLVSRMAMTTQSIQRIAQGDLSHHIDAGSENELGQMLAELEKMRLALTSTVAGIRDGVGRIYSNAQEIANGNNDLSSRTEEQASALQETAASMEQIKTTVRQNADNAHSARQLAKNASDNASNGGKVMSNLESIMQQISQSSRQIADINGVIDSIANQTNILSLNAAVEAARAGEQGRGFAVVAEEVRSLAKRSADAAKEIKELITTCVAIMDTGTQQVGNASIVMNEIVSSVSQVTEIMGEITLASDEQSAGINQIAQAVNEMDLVTQQNATLVEEAAAAASNLEKQSETLENIVGKFTLQSSEYVSNSAMDSVMPRNNRRLAIKHHHEGQWESF
ncbi:methyl-accepting chemotaxis protein [Enterobacterales bacterium CwR94]|nr:methyl-accepting chemotaxis protein [Enterobacterales bacterium CwR94]